MWTAKEFKSFQNHLKSFGVCFLFRKCKVNKKRANIYARITVDGEEKHSLLKNKLMSINWNRNKGVVKGNNITSNLSTITWKISGLALKTNTGNCSMQMN